MNTIAIDQLEPNRFYWASRRPVNGVSAAEDNEVEVVQVSTVFGASAEFWTVAVMGSDEHFDLSAFDFFHKVPSPPQAAAVRANLTVVPPIGRQLGH